MNGRPVYRDVIFQSQNGATILSRYSFLILTADYDYLETFLSKVFALINDIVSLPNAQNSEIVMEELCRRQPSHHIHLHTHQRLLVSSVISDPMSSFVYSSLV